MARTGIGTDNGQQSHFDKITGRNEYQRQSWRDNFNGGRAAGDWTGNVNDRLTSERESFGGATWGGSSSQPSALEHARNGGGQLVNFYAADGTRVGGITIGGARGMGPGNIQVGASPTAGPGSQAASGVPSGAPSPAGQGPGAAVVTTKPTQPRPGNRTPLIQFGTPPLEPGAKMKATDGYAGIRVEANPWFSDVENWWEPRYGEPGEWLGGIVNIAMDGVWQTGKAAEAFHNSQFIQGSANTIDRMFADGMDRVTAPLSRQEPVDWGR